MSAAFASPFSEAQEQATKIESAEVADLRAELRYACKEDDAFLQRQCLRTQVARKNSLVRTTFALSADSKVKLAGAGKAAKISVELPFACKGDDWAFTGGACQGSTLTVPAPATVGKDGAGLAVDYVVTPAANGKITVSALRIADKCTGAVVFAKPASDSIAPDPDACEKKVEAEKPVDTGPEIPDQLSRQDVAAALEPVKTSAQGCFDTFGIPGKATLKIKFGGDGRVISYKQEGDFADTPTGACIDAAAKSLQFAKSKKASTQISYPIALQ